MKLISWRICSAKGNEYYQKFAPALDDGMIFFIEFRMVYSCLTNCVYVL
jgi:hypothetical protein